MSDPRWDVFIAHASSNQAEAAALYELLAPSARVFVQSRSLAPGDNWQTRTAEELRASRITLALVSPRMEHAYYANEEIAIAIDLARKDPSRHRVIPVLVAAAGWDTPRPYGLQSLHALLAGDREGMGRAAEAVLGLLGLRPGVPPSGTGAWAAPRPAGAEPDLPVIRVAPDERYPALQFVTDDGRTEWAGSPAQLAALLEVNPQHGETFLYDKYFRGPWGDHAPGVCAALSAIVDRRFPGDRLAGRMAALYVLDPDRPYRDGEERAEGPLALAEHLRAHAARYREALQDPRHPLWFHLRFWRSEAGRQGMRAFQDPFAALGAEPGEHGAAAAVALNRLILWLRGLGEDPRLPVAGALLAAPADALALSPDARHVFAGELADETSLASTWIGETAPELGRLVATWRRTHPGDPATLPYALGAGVPAGSGVVLSPADALDGPRTVTAALWADDAGPLRDRVDAYLATFHFAPLARHALDWLRGAPAAPHAGAVAAYVATHLDAAGGTDEPRALIPVLFAALDAAGDGDREEARVLDRLARRSTAALEAVDADRPRGERLAEWLTAAASAASTASSIQVRRWRGLLERMDGALAALHRRASAEVAQLSGAADDALADALDTLARAGIPLTFAARHRREREAYRLHAREIDAAVEEDRQATERAMFAAEQAERAALRQATEASREVAELRAGVRRARWAQGVLAAGVIGGLLLAGGMARQLLRAARQYAAVMPEHRAGIADLLGSFAIGELDHAGAFPLRLAGACALLGFTLALAVILVAIRPSLPRVLAWTAALFLPALAAVRAGAAPSAHPVAAAMVLPAGLAAAVVLLLFCGRIARGRAGSAHDLVAHAGNGAAARLRDQRLAQVQEALRLRETAWRAKVRRAVALADDPAAVPIPPAPLLEPVSPLPAPPAPGRSASTPPPRWRTALGWGLSAGVAAVAVLGMRDPIPRPEWALVIVRCPDFMEDRPAALLAEWHPREGSQTRSGWLPGTPSLLIGPYPRSRAEAVSAEVRATLHESNPFGMGEVSMLKGLGLQSSCDVSLEVRDAP